MPLFCSKPFALLSAFRCVREGVPITTWACSSAEYAIITACRTKKAVQPGYTPGLFSASSSALSNALWMWVPLASFRDHHKHPVMRARNAGRVHFTSLWALFLGNAALVSMDLHLHLNWCFGILFYQAIHSEQARSSNSACLSTQQENKIVRLLVQNNACSAAQQACSMAILHMHGSRNTRNASDTHGQLALSTKLEQVPISSILQRSPLNR